MADFTIHTLDKAPAHARSVLEDVQDKYGFIPNLMGALSEAPQVARSYMALSQALADSSLTPTERHVAWFTVNVEHNCTYCMAAHTAIANKDGIASEVIEAARDGTPYADERLNALRGFVQLLVRQRGFVEPEKVQAFLAAGFAQRNVYELLLVISQKVLSNYTNHLVETPVDKQFSAFVWQAPERVAAE